MVTIFNQSIIYWSIIALLGVIHVHVQFMILPFDIPIYFTVLFVFIIIYLLQKQVLLQITNLSKGCNAFLLGMQILLIINYLGFDPNWLYLTSLLLFISIEAIRIVMGKRLWKFEQTIKDFTEERVHMNETFRIVRSERHEFLKHISAIHFMLENEQPHNAKNYLDELVDQYEETNLSIKGERGTVAGVLHHMYQQAKREGIEIVYDLDVPISTLPISDKQLVTLIGNLLSNSIDASIDWQNQHHKTATLTLQFYKRSGLFLIICKNKSLPIPSDVLDNLFHSYGNTTKDGEHKGLGTKLVHDIVREYNGFLDFTFKNEEFTVKIKIPAIK